MTTKKALAKTTNREVSRVSEADNLLSIIDRAARDPNVDVDKMDRLLQMRMQLIAQQAQADFNEALAVMQPLIPTIQERGNANGRYTYARWEDINEVIKPILAEYGFALNFETLTGDGWVEITAILRHRGGADQRSVYRLPNDVSGNKNVVQASGSSSSYGKRYTASALLNLQSTLIEDDDGRAAGTRTISQEQFNELDSILETEGVDKTTFCKRYQIDAVSNLPEVQLPLVWAELKNRRLEQRLKKEGKDNG